VSGVGFSVAIGWPLLMGAALVMWWPGVWPVVANSLLVVAIGAAACARWFQRRLGGITGDTLGATQQLTELLVLLSWVAWLR
jgi:adenosylcobinamide-GDP ribazoletransferase